MNTDMKELNSVEHGSNLLLLLLACDGVVIWTGFMLLVSTGSRCEVVIVVVMLLLLLLLLFCYC